LGKIIDVQFRPHERGRWCLDCDEPFPEGTALCPRCGGELHSAARHRDEARERARREARRAVATGAAGVVLLVGALLAWLLLS
jgi:predicted amidophosphoribosyltransferase